MIEAIVENLARYWQLYGLLLVYTLMLAWHAWEGNKDTDGVADYYVGGRAMGGVVIGLSFFATYGSTNSFVGFTGQAYSWGTPWFLLVPFVLFFALFAWLVIAPRLRHFTGALDSLTIPDFLGFRFDSTPARVLSAVVVLFASFFYLTAVFKGIGHLLEHFMEIPYTWAIGVVYVITMLYTAVGGFISVIKTDAVQGVLLGLAAIVLFTGTIDAAGGIGSLEAVYASEANAELFSWGGGVSVPVLLGVLFAATVKFVVEPRQLSRFYALESSEAAKTGVWICVGLFALAYALLVPIGLYAHNILPAGIQDTDLIVPQLLTSAEVFSAGTAAFLMVAMVAAAMSSVDSVLLVMGSTCERDIVGMLKPDKAEGKVLRDTRLYVALFATITALISLDPPAGIVLLTAFSGALYAACFFPSVLLGLWWRPGNGATVTSSILAGFATLLLWRFVPGSEILHEVFPAVIVSFAVYVTVALYTDQNRSEVVDRLFETLEEEREREPAPPVAAS